MRPAWASSPTARQASRRVAGQRLLGRQRLAGPDGRAPGIARAGAAGAPRPCPRAGRSARPASPSRAPRARRSRRGRRSGTPGRRARGRARATTGSEPSARIHCRWIACIDADDALGGEARELLVAERLDVLDAVADAGRGARRAVGVERAAHGAIADRVRRALEARAARRARRRGRSAPGSGHSGSQAAALAVGLLEPRGARLDDAVDEELRDAAAPALAVRVAQVRPALELVPRRVGLDVQRRDDAHAQLAARLELAQLVVRRGRCRPSPCTAVRPGAAMRRSASARRSTALLRASAAACARSTSSKAAGSSRAPVGRPSRHTTSALPSSARGPSMPAAASAAGVASAVWKSKNVSSAGAPPTASAIELARQLDRRRTSRTRASGRAPTAPARSARARPPARRAPRRASRARRGRRRPSRRRPCSGCWCASTSPGTSASPPPSIDLACARRRPRARWRRRRPRRSSRRATATAVAHGCAGSSVRIRAPSTASVGGAAHGREPSGHDCAMAAATQSLARGAHFAATSGLIGALVRRARAHERALARHDLRDVARSSSPAARSSSPIATIAAGGTPLAAVVGGDRAQRAPPALRARGRAVPARPALEARALEPDRARRVDRARARAADARARPARVLRLRLLAVRGLEPRHADRRARGRRDRRPLRARARRRLPGQHARPARAAAAPARHARGRARRRRDRAARARRSPRPACRSCWPPRGVLAARLVPAREPA